MRVVVSVVERRPKALRDLAWGERPAGLEMEVDTGVEGRLTRVLSGWVVLQSTLDLTVRLIREALIGLKDSSKTPSSSEERLRLGEALRVIGSTFSESESKAGVCLRGEAVSNIRACHEDEKTRFLR